MKFPPKWKQKEGFLFLFHVMLHIQLGRKPKQDVGPHKDVDSPEWGYSWCM